MASVRISKNLRDQIKRIAAELFTKPAQRAAAALADDFPDRLMTEIWETMFSEYINFIPEELCIEVQSIAGYIKTNYKGVPVTWYILKDCVKTYQIPKINDLYNNKAYVLNNYNPSEKLANEYGKFRARVDKVRKEKEDFVAQLNNTLEKCNTLKQFLEAWPDGEQFVPEDVMIKHNTVSEKHASREAIEPEVITNLSSVLMRRKIGDTIHK